MERKLLEKPRRMKQEEVKKIVKFPLTRKGTEKKILKMKRAREFHLENMDTLKKRANGELNENQLETKLVENKEKFKKLLKKDYYELAVPTSASSFIAGVGAMMVAKDPSLLVGTASLVAIGEAGIAHTSIILPHKFSGDFQPTGKEHAKLRNRKKALKQIKKHLKEIDEEAMNKIEDRIIEGKQVSHAEFKQLKKEFAKTLATRHQYAAENFEAAVNLLEQYKTEFDSLDSKKQKVKQQKDKLRKWRKKT
jgi:hypothetical protein